MDREGAKLFVTSQSFESMNVLQSFKKMSGKFLIAEKQLIIGFLRKMFDFEFGTYVVRAHLRFGC